MEPTPIHVDNVETVNSTPTAGAPANDTLTVRLVVVLLGLTVNAIVVASTILAIQDRTLPPELVTLGGVGVGALGAMLASTASKRT